MFLYEIVTLITYENNKNKLVKQQLQLTNAHFLHLVKNVLVRMKVIALRYKITKSGIYCFIVHILITSLFLTYYIHHYYLAKFSITDLWFIESLMGIQEYNGDYGGLT